MELVVKTPRHPYTQLLIGSIPRVSTVRDWAEETAADDPMAVAGHGCRFADRCPVGLPVCLEQRPPLYLTAPGRAAACVRLSSDPVLAASGLSGLLAPKGSQAASGGVAAALTQIRRSC